jgi:predicted nucleic acid-binding protein
VGVTAYLADKSALARLHLPAVQEVLVPLMDRGLVSMCGVTQAEMLYSARNPDDRRRLRSQLASALCWAETPHDLWTRVDELQEALTEKAQHRSASVPDLIVAATAEASGLTVLHYDGDFDTIAACTGQPVRWVVDPGTV